MLRFGKTKVAKELDGAKKKKKKFGIFMLIMWSSQNQKQRTLLSV